MEITEELTSTDYVFEFMNLPLIDPFSILWQFKITEICKLIL